MPKRGANTQAKSATNKKAKVVETPVDKNFATVLSALTNDEYIIPGPESCREMLVAVAPAAMTTPKDARHEDQEAVIGMVREIFTAEKMRWETRVAEANSAVDTAKAEHAEKITAKDAADADVRAQKKEVAAKLDAQAIAMEVVQECEEELQKARDLYGAANATQKSIIDEQEHALGMQEMIKALKDGSIENPKELKKQLTTITSFLKTLEVEEALVKTLPQILGRAPADRGNFDEIALQQLNSYLDSHFNILSNRIETAGVEVKEHDMAVTAWGAAVDLSQEKKCNSDVALKAAQDQQENLESVLTSARKVVREHGAAVKHRSSELAKEEVGLQNVEAILEALNFLEAYTTPPPQEESIDMEEVATEDMDVENIPSPMKNVTAGTLVA